MKNKRNLLLICYLFFVTIVSYGQQKIEITATLDTIRGTFHVAQKIHFKNQTGTAIQSIAFNDWNHAYSNRKTKLGKRFSDQYVRNFHLSNEKERGYTKINSFTINQFYANWKRTEEAIDVIELSLNSLQPNDSVVIAIDYELKIPDAKFTRWGKEKNNYYLKDMFLLMAKIQGAKSSITYSNENLEDAYLENIDAIQISFVNCSKFTIESNLKKISNSQFEGKDIQDLEFALEKKSLFESYKNDKMEVTTNLYNSRINEIQKALVIDKVTNYLYTNLGPSKVDKIMVSQIDYDRNPFYGLNQLPAFLSPFPDSFLYELKFLKVYSQNYLKQNLQIDFRKDHYLLDGIQTFLLINYLEENYPDLHLVGNLSKWKLTRGYQLAKATFNDQYYLAYLLMARKNLDQSLDTPKDLLVKFNEQISSKYKAGLAFKFLDTYLNNEVVEKSILEFLALNKNNSTSSIEFEKILKTNSTKNIDWFFQEMIHSNTSIDYSFGKITTSNTTKEINIVNKTKSAVPLLVSGYKNRNKVFDKWIDEPKTDTIISIQNSEVDRLLINNNNYFAEINNRNNYKTLKGFPYLNKPIKFTLVRDIENANYHQIFYVPEIGFNVYDGAILSLTLNNKSLIERPFSYTLSPSYSSNTQSLSGITSISYNFQKKDAKLFSTRVGIGSSYFHYLKDAAYWRLTPSVQFRFREKDLRSNKGQSLTLRQVIVNKEFSPESKDSISPLRYSVLDIRFNKGNSETAYGFGYSNNLQLASNFGKIITEVGYRKLFENNYQISGRIYAGIFLYNNSNSDFYSFGLDRPKDYLFDYSYYGRSENSGIFSQQLIIAEGGFKSKFANPYANQWMTTFNATSSIWKWIQLYGDVGLYKNKGLNPKFVYDSGIHLNLVPDYFELFLPMYSSNGFEMGQKNYQEKIRFIVTLSPRTLVNLFTRKWF